jgi:hypothetical protein
MACGRDLRLMSEDVPPVAGTRRRATRWFHELADELSFVDGSAVVWLPRPGEFAQPLVLPRQRRVDDGYHRRAIP